MGASRRPHLLVMAGGTGGHVFPGLAVAKLLSQRGWQITWLGTATRIEADLVPQHGFSIEFLSIKGIRGDSFLFQLISPLKVLKAICQAVQIFLRVKPTVVIGMGGFTSGPGGIAAWLMKLPLIIHEQNSIAGMTNRWLNYFANQSLCAFSGSLGGATVVGNPVRTSVLKVGQIKRVFRSQLNVLVVGGSSGATVLNEQFPQVVQLCQNLALQVHHQVGRGNVEPTLSRYLANGIANIQIEEFIDDMAEAYRWADLVICRAGALTVSELAVAGVPAIFIPLPQAVDDHQTRNARFLVRHQVARLLPQSQLTAQTLSQLLQELASPVLRKRMSRGALKLAITDAAARVARVCEQWTNK